MNRCYRLVWNRARQLLVVASEISRGRGKAGRTSRAQRLAWLAVLPLSLSPVLGMAMAVSGAIVPAVQTPRPALPVTSPSGGQVTAGSGAINQSGLTTTINQHSQNLSLNWQSFNVGADSTVNFVQPNARSVAVNRIADTNGSVILGHVNANGQVFLINPNGVLFGQGAQVNVGGLVASTLNISDSELANGTRHFSGNGSGSVINQGTITAANGGYIALLGPQVTNQGTLRAPDGTVALAGGNAVTLSFDSNRLLSLQVDKSTLNALADNRQLIVANGGQVLMSAGAKDSLLASVVNNSGTIQAQTVENRAGKIVLLGGMAAGTTQVAGTLDASAPTGGNGGFIETSAAHVKVADGTRITTLAKAGNAGTWLIDPTDFTIAAGSGAQTSSSIGADTLSSSLGSGNVTIATAASGSENGDIHVNSSVSWSANELTLSAHGDININADLNGSGTAKLALEYGQATVAGTGSGYTLRGARVNLAAGNNFSTKQGSGGATQVYTVVTLLGVAADTTTTSLQGIGNNLAGHYVLGGDIDASATSGWNGGEGFDPLGDFSTPFTGTFEGMGHTISGLSIERPSGYNIGLFGYTGIGSAIRNLGSLGGSVSGAENVGGLVGYNDHGTVTQAYVTSAVSGNKSVGGLVGYNTYGTISQSHATGTVGSVGCIWCGGLVGQHQAGGMISQSYATGTVNGQVDIGGLAGVMSSSTISQSYASGAVSGNENVGGLAGYSDTGTIIRSYATGAVTGSTAVGGLLGYMYPTTITQSYATGAVSGTSSVGGLVGSGYGGTISSSYWDTYSTGQAVSVGSTATITSDPAQSSAANYAFKQSAYIGFDFTAGTGAWFMVDGSTRPFLQSEYSTTINNAHQLQLMAMNLGASYTLGSNIDASATGHALTSGAANAAGMWSNAGFAPIGNINTSWFTGIFDGLGHTISGLTINRPYTSNVGLFGLMQGTIRNVGLLGGSVAGDSFVGGLAGLNSGGTITRAYTTGTVSGSGEQVGGLVGTNTGTISQSYAAGAVSAPVRVGGLVGLNNGSISQSYATGAVNGAEYAGGGLVGNNDGTINQSYATGAVSGTQYVGGLVGTGGGPITSSYWDTETTGQATSAGGGTGKSTAEMRQASTFAGWDLATSGGSNAVWRIYEGHTAPLLRAFMTNLTLAGAPDVAVTYNGNVQSGASISAPSGVLGAAATGTNAGFYNGYYSTQQGYDLTGGNLTINAIILNAISLNGTRAYDGTTNVAAGIFTLSGLVGGQDLTLTGTGTIADKSVGTYNVNLGSLTLGDGTTGLASNYTFTGGTQTATITQADLVVTGLGAANRIYDATNVAVLTGTGTIAKFGDDDVSLTGTASGTFVDKNVGLGKIVTVGGNGLGGADAGNYHLVQQTGLSADITPALLAITSTDVSKTYDGVRDASGTLVVSNGTLFGSDSLSGGNFSFADKNAGTGKHVTVSGVSVSDGNNGSNYTVSYIDNVSSSILAKAIASVGGLGAIDKVYDGTTTASLNLGGASFAGVIAGDDLSVGNATANFSDRNAANGKAVTIKGITLTGGDAGNYTLTDTTASTTANISQLGITVDATGSNKVYDGSTNDTVALASGGVLSGDTVSFSGIGHFADKNVGNGKAVGVSGITATGANAGNYRFSTTANTIANITPATLTYRADSAVFLAGQMPGALSGAVTGWVGGDTLTDATEGTLAWSTPASSASPVGQYAIDGSGLSALNYVFAQAPDNAAALRVANGSASRVVTAAVAGLQAEAAPDDDAHIRYASTVRTARAPTVHIVGGGVRLP